MNTTIPTRDLDNILLTLAELAQFQRLAVNAVALYPSLAGTLEYIRARQAAQRDGYSRPLECLDIPVILTEVHRELHRRMDAQTRIDPERIPAAVAAFAGILCAEEQP